MKAETPLTISGGMGGGRVESMKVFTKFLNKIYKAFSYDVTAAMLVFQNKEMATMMVCKTNSQGIEL